VICTCCMGWSIVLVRNCASDKDSGDSGACFGVDGLPSLGARGCGPAICLLFIQASDKSICAGSRWVSPRDIYLLFLRVLYDLHTLVPRGTSPRDNQLGYSYLQVHSIHTYIKKGMRNLRMWAC